MARLQWAYHAASPDVWLRLDPELRDGLLGWIPRLEAEGALLDATVAILPHLKDEARRRILRDWERQARSGLDGAPAASGETAPDVHHGGTFAGLARFLAS